MKLGSERARTTRARGCRPRAGTIAGVLAGALAAYFLAPDRGHARRRLVRDRAAASVRHGRRRLQRTARLRAAALRGRMLGLSHRLRRGEEIELDDATLAHKVESVLFRDPTVPKGRISINAERGVVFLRGEVATDDVVGRLGRAVAGIPGVHGVENLLHLPGTPAPHAAPASHRPE